MNFPEDTIQRIDFIMSAVAENLRDRAEAKKYHHIWVVYLTAYFFYQIGNGTFSQFFYNTQEQFNDDVKPALTEIGDTIYSETYDKVLDRFNQNQAEKQTYLDEGMPTDATEKLRTDIREITYKMWDQIAQDENLKEIPELLEAYMNEYLEEIIRELDEIRSSHK